MYNDRKVLLILNAIWNDQMISEIERRELVGDVLDIWFDINTLTKYEQDALTKYGSEVEKKVE